MTDGWVDVWRNLPPPSPPRPRRACVTQDYVPSAWARSTDIERETDALLRTVREIRNLKE